MKPSSIRTLSRLVLVSALAFAGAASAQSSDSANASANVSAGITVINTGDLDFGGFMPSGTAGTVTVTTGDVQVVSGGVTANGGTPTAATFSVSGTANQVYTITLPTDAAALVLRVGSDTTKEMELTAFRAKAATGNLGTDHTATGTLTA